jgi:hypothetical protein
LYGTPTLVGNNFIFTPNVFRAESISGSGNSTLSSTINNILLTAHAGYALSGIAATQFGDYRLWAPGSSVSMSGQITAYNLSDPAGTFSAAAFAPAALTVADNLNHDWSTSAALTAGGGGVAAGLFNAAQIGFSMHTDLTAFSSTALVRGFSYGMIENKAAIVGVVNTVATVPLPAAWLLLLVGGSGLGFVARRPRRRANIVF